MNEKSKIFVLIGVVIAFVAVIVGYNIYFNYRSEQIYKIFEESYNSSETKIVLIGREGCSWCQLFKPILDFYKEKYEFSYEYLDTDKLTDNDLNKILDKLEVDAGDFGTPLLSFVKNRKSLENINGYVDEQKLLVSLQKQGFISEAEVVLVNYLTDYKTVENTFKSKDKQIIVVGQTSCSYCIMFKPILMNVVDKYGVKINYINYDKIEEQEELEKYLVQYEPFQGNWGTPLTLIVEEEKVLDTFNGYSTESNYVAFLKENGFIEEK